MKIYADGPNSNDIHRLIVEHDISGVTTNPTLASEQSWLSGSPSKYYESFCVSIAAATAHAGIPVSLEVLATEPDEMFRQAVMLSQLGEHVYVKIPCQTIHGVSTAPLVHTLSVGEHIRVNVTAITDATYFLHLDALEGGAPSILSVFAGRIADTGVNSVMFIRNVAKEVKQCGNSMRQCEVLWASCREAYNLYQAAAYGMGVDIITVSVPILEKYKAMRNKPLNQVSIETVRQFAADSRGMTLEF